MNILITGCNGQLGRELQAIEKDYPEHAWFNTDIETLDITNREAINTFVEQKKIDGIVNCAAYTAVDRAEEDQDLCTLLNATAPEYLAFAIEQRKGWIIQISTDYVFDGSRNSPYTESEPTSPSNIYGSTKLAGEFAVTKRCQKAMIIRTSWLYSPFGHNYVRTMLHLGETQNELGVVFDQTGTPTYALDLAKAIMQIISQKIVPGVFHYSNEGVTSWYDFTLAIHEIANINDCYVKPLRTKEYPTKARRPAYSVLDKAKIKRTYDIFIPHWQSSLRDCIAEILNEK